MDHATAILLQLFVIFAAAFVATSAGITARVLKQLGALQRIEAHVILGAAVIDDILAMSLLTSIIAPPVLAVLLKRTPTSESRTTPKA